ncbi:hypothetical protein FRACYDRAFT_244983 [Fragilariopsis cylindrus CCMP1102]|uniref:Uncharacterized protein n=1 Tax=Fragilariopsis cylindrus CCMP1102 TaxID=635003 RepID=A0A1E7F216_9STRA|nr:hypothetical protein FRACYDRAFT_244983 [Fragilariopsis cylindrus CCMP1102]|eukprot:OEU11863.1 hypothetical protein FRACYDRAFT_244983 [Fragilariopsis cylindrus CCMP1102]
MTPLIPYPNELGYLVGNYKDYDKQLIKFTKAWEFTKWMDTQQFNNSDDKSSNSNSNSNSKQERRYHFYSKERPTIVELSNTTLTQLNSVVYHTNQKKYSPEFYTTSKVAIQKVHKVNIKNDMLFFGCFSHNYDRYLEEKNTFFLKNTNNNNNNNTNNVDVDVNLNTTNTSSFSNNLRESIQIMKRLLKLQPKMYTDFQVLFDSNGYVYFLDIEAQYELTARWKIGLKEKQQDCLQKIDDIKITANNAVLQQ